MIKNLLVLYMNIHDKEVIGIPSMNIHTLCEVTFQKGREQDIPYEY